MRITGGQYKGIPLVAPKGTDTRPTTDKVRQALFNILNHASWFDGFQNSFVLDAFAGTGALGLEALSYGAERAVFWDISKQALESIKTNVEKTKAGEKCLILKRNGAGDYPPLEKPFDVIFLDPPYKKNLGAKALHLLHEKGGVHAETLIVSENAKGFPEPYDSEVFEELDKREYGDTEIRFLKLR